MHASSCGCKWGPHSESGTCYSRPNFIGPRWAYGTTCAACNAPMGVHQVVECRCRLSTRAGEQNSSEFESESHPAEVAIPVHMDTVASCFLVVAAAAVVVLGDDLDIALLAAAHGESVTQRWDLGCGRHAEPCSVRGGSSSTASTESG